MINRIEDEITLLNRVVGADGDALLQSDGPYGHAYRPLRSTTIWKLRVSVSRKPVRRDNSVMLARASSSLAPSMVCASAIDVPSGRRYSIVAFGGGAVI